MAHKCAANGCDVRMDDPYLMCRRHWFMVPYRIKQAVYRAYRPGQGMCDASDAWFLAAALAVEAVAAAEGHPADNPFRRALTERAGDAPAVGEVAGRRVRPGPVALAPEQAAELARANAAPLVRSELAVLWARADMGLLTEDDLARVLRALEEKSWRVGQSGHVIPLDAEQRSEVTALAALGVAQRGGSFVIRSISGSIEWRSDGLKIKPCLPM